MAQTVVRSSDSSDKKTVRAELVFLGGRYTSTNWCCRYPASVNTTHSNVVAVVTATSLMRMSA